MEKHYDCELCEDCLDLQESIQEAIDDRREAVKKIIMALEKMEAENNRLAFLG